MATPGFTAGATLRRFTTERGSLPTEATVATMVDGSGLIVPAQQFNCCQTAAGRCTGFGGVSSATLAGTTRTCTFAFNYAWVTVCRDINSGAITAVSSGCAGCLW